MPDQKKNILDWTSVDWEPLINRLRLYTLKRSRLIGGTGDLEPLDFVQQSIVKTITGTRKWDGKRDLFKHLVGVINSDINHYRSSHNFKKKGHGEVEHLAEDNSEQKQQEIHSEVEAFFEYLEQKGDSELLELALTILDKGYSSSIDIGLDMKLSSKEVNNLKKRLKRVALEFQEKVYDE